jgi:hypothetical protein
VVDQNLWNEKFRLKKKFAIFHLNEHTFRKTPKDLQKVELKEKEQAGDKILKSLILQKSRCHSRNEARTLERVILQQRSGQKQPEKSDKIA